MLLLSMHGSSMIRGYLAFTFPTCPYFNGKIARQEISSIRTPMIGCC